jgi:hypothetical protein
VLCPLIIEGIGMKRLGLVSGGVEIKGYNADRVIGSVDDGIIATSATMSWVGC